MSDRYDAGYGQHKYLHYHEHSENCEWKHMQCTCGLWDKLDTSAVEPLIKDLEQHGKHIDEGDLAGMHYPARAHLVGALGKIGDVRAVEPLIKILERIPDERNSEIVWITVTALGMIGDDRAYEPIIQTFGYSDEGESFSFWLSGGEVKDYGGKKLTVNPDALARALGDSVEAVRSHCAEILDKLNWKLIT